MRIPNGTRVDVRYGEGRFTGWIVTYAPDLGGYVVGLEPSGEQWVAPRSDVSERRPGRPVACPCECNSGGFCGGCGHAGCGGRR